MLKLFKYEMRKTLMSKLIMLGLAICLEGYFLYSTLKANPDNATIATILVMLAGFAGVLFIGIQSIVTLHHDMNTKQSYMLFMTPHSNYAILGAKALECTVSVILTGLFFFGLCSLNVSMLFSKFGDIRSLKEFMMNILKTMNSSIALDPSTLAAFTVNVAAGWIETVMLAFFADVIATALLKGRKFSGLLSFILFVALNYMFNSLMSLIPSAATMVAALLVSAAAYLVIAAAVYIGTATLMEKKLSV